MDRQLHIQVDEHHPLAVIRLSGFCAQLEVYKLKSDSEWQLSSGNRFLIMDLKELTFIDSAGIGALMQLSDRCRSIGGEMAFVSQTNSNMRRILEKSLAAQRLEFFATADDALEAIKKKNGLGRRAEPAASGDLKLLQERLAAVEKRLERLERILRPPDATH